MHAASQVSFAIAVIFVLGGLAKGVAGMGLPTVAMGLLGLLMTPANAAALVIIPSLVTNIWQFLSGQHHLALVRRMRSMMIAICLVTSGAAGLTTGAGAGRATVALGFVLIVYSALGLARIDLSVPRKHEVWLSPAVGAVTGIVTAGTGVFVIPAVPYLQALGFGKDDLIQLLGLSFTISTLALAAGLASHGAFRTSDAEASSLCIVPALIGMSAGQVLRSRVSAARFRTLFLTGMLLLGAELMLRALF